MRMKMKLAAMSVLLALFGYTPFIPAATLTVTNSADDGPGSLREAVSLATSGDTIDFAVTGTITLTNGTLLIQTNLTIFGPGADQLTIYGDNWSHSDISDTSFTICSNCTVTINGLKITGYNYYHYDEDGRGGAVFNSGILTLNNCVISDSYSADGGGIYNTGSLTLNNCTISDNWTGWEQGLGGGVYNSGSATLSNCTISNNYGMYYGVGEGIYNSGNLILDNCIITANTANIGSGVGIAIEAGSAIIRNCSIMDNSHDHTGDGGGIYNQGFLAVTNSMISGNVAKEDINSNVGRGRRTLEPRYGSTGEYDRQWKLCTKSRRIRRGNLQRRNPHAH